MGNQPSSSSSRPASNPQSPNATLSHAPAFAHHASASHARELNPADPRVGRRQSIQALSIRATAAPPSATLENARSQTIAAPPVSTKKLQATHDTLKSASEEKMGNEQSRHKGHGARDTHQQQQLTPPKQPPPSAAVAQALAQEKPAPSPQTRPVDVPSLPREDTTASRTEQSSIDPADASQEYFIPPSQFSRPPRLPLPIEEEVHTPGSPIISPADLANPAVIGDVDGVLPRRSSVLSSTTADDDDEPTDYQGPQNVPTVPTVIEWEGPGERIYVTGTFANWDRKYKLHRK
jgi:hypothetical protein